LVYAKATDKSEPPTVWTLESIHEKTETFSGSEQFVRDILPVLEELARGLPYLERQGTDIYVAVNVANVFISHCYSCHDITIWKHNVILYPPTRYEVEANSDLPDDIRADFEEARSVLELSPRSAAALLRLCIQKLCKYLGEPGKNLNDDIGVLVKKKGLDPRVQKALDIVRVVGNNAVHPGELDLSDDRETSAKLFELVNRIAFDMITHPKEVDALFAEKLPQGAKDQIAKRDG
jgi:hypothetical protein